MTAALAGAAGMAAIELGALNLSAHTATGVFGAGVDFQSDGALVGTGDIASFSPADEWWSKHAFGDGSLYEVAYTTLVSGSNPNTGTSTSPSTSTYYALSSSRSWSLNTASADGGVWRFRVREIANTANYVEADITINVSGL